VVAVFLFLLSGLCTNAKHACPPDPHSLNVGVWYLFSFVGSLFVDWNSYLFGSVHVRQTLTVRPHPPSPATPGESMQSARREERMVEFGIFSFVFVFCLLSGLRTHAEPARPPDPQILNVGVLYL
jgi:hypothetical protein